MSALLTKMRLVECMILKKKKKLGGINIFGLLCVSNVSTV